MTMLIEELQTEIVEKQEEKRVRSKGEVKYKINLPLYQNYEHFLNEDLKGYIAERILTTAKSRDFDGIEDEYVSHYINFKIKTARFNSTHQIELSFTQEEFNTIIRNIIDIKLTFDLHDITVSDYITYFMIA